MRFEYRERVARSLSPTPLLPSAFGVRSARSVTPDMGAAMDSHIISTHSFRKDSFSDHVDQLLARARALRQYRTSSVEPYQYSGLLDDVEEPCRQVPVTRMSSLVCPPLSPWNRTGLFYYPSYNYWIWNAYTPVEQQLEDYRTRVESEVEHRLNLSHSQQIWEHREECGGPVSMEIEYIYPESWRGTATTQPVKRDYYYWANPGRHYRYRTYYPSYYNTYSPRYRRYFR